MSERKRGVVLNYGLILTNILIALVYTPIMIRFLGQSEFGLYSIVNSIIGYLTVLDLGFGNAIVIYTARYHQLGQKKKEQKLHNMFFFVYCIIGVVAFLIGLILFFASDKIFGQSMTAEELGKAKIMMLILSANLLVTFPFSIYSSIITAYEKFTFQKTIAIVRSLLNPIVMLPLLLLGYKSITMVAALSLLNVLMLVANYLYCRYKLNINIHRSTFDKKLFREIFGFSFFIFLNVVVDKINWSVDQFVLGAVAGTVAVSVYAIAAQINNLYLTFSTAISSVLVPKITKMVAKNATNRQLTDEMLRVGRLQLLFVMLVMSGFVIFGRQFINLWVGSEFETAYYIGIILMLPVTIPIIQNLAIAIIQAKKMHKFRSIVYSLVAVANIFLSIPLAKAYGGIGSAIGTAISLIIGNIIIMNIYYSRKVGLLIGYFWKEMIWLFLKQLPFLALAFWIAAPINPDNILQLGLPVVIYTISYGLYHYLAVINQDEKELVKKVWSKLTRAKEKK